VELLRQQLIRAVRRILHHHEDAEDVVQEAIGRLIDHRQNGHTVLNEAAFARKAAVHLAIDTLRRRNGRAAHLEQFAKSRSDESQHAPATPEDVARLYEAIATLPPRQAAVITLHKLLELEYEEVAALLGITQANCRSHCRYGMRSLATKMGKA